MPNYIKNNFGLDNDGVILITAFHIYLKTFIKTTPVIHAME